MTSTLKTNHPQAPQTSVPPLNLVANFAGVRDELLAELGSCGHFRLLRARPKWRHSNVSWLNTAAHNMRSGFPPALMLC